LSSFSIGFKQETIAHQHPHERSRNSPPAKNNDHRFQGNIGAGSEIEPVQIAQSANPTERGKLFIHITLVDLYNAVYHAASTRVIAPKQAPVCPANNDR
jgi:hypothetical protein